MNGIKIDPKDRPSQGSAKELFSRASADLWHQQLGHPADEMLKQLPKAALGVEIDGKGPDPCQHCEIYKISDAPHQVSHHPMPKGEKPWEIVYFDLVFMILAYSGDHEVERLKDKGQRTVFESIGTFECCMQWQGFNVKLFHLDSKCMLVHKWDKLVREEGFKFQPTLPYMPDQNSPAE